VPVDFDACPYGRPFTYHRLSSLGVRIELVDTSVQQAFLDTWYRARLQAHSMSAQQRRNSWRWPGSLRWVCQESPSSRPA